MRAISSVSNKLKQLIHIKR